MLTIIRNVTLLPVEILAIFTMNVNYQIGSLQDIVYSKCPITLTDSLTTTYFPRGTSFVNGGCFS